MDGFICLPLSSFIWPPQPGCLSRLFGWAVRFVSHSLSARMSDGRLPACGSVEGFVSFYLSPVVFPAWMTGTAPWVGEHMCVFQVCTCLCVLSKKHMFVPAQHINACAAGECICAYIGACRVYCFSCIHMCVPRVHTHTHVCLNWTCVSELPMWPRACAATPFFHVRALTRYRTR